MCRFAAVKNPSVSESFFSWCLSVSLYDLFIVYYLFQCVHAVFKLMGVCVCFYIFDLCLITAVVL